MADEDKQGINLALCREKLAYKNAYIIRGEGYSMKDSSLLGDVEITIGWKEGVLDHYEEMRQYLDLYTSPENTDTPLRYVLDPVIDGVKYEGRWRQAFVARIRDAEGNYVLAQTLRKGYITTLGSSALDYTEARLKSGQDYAAGTCTINPGGNTTENYVTVYWPNVSPDNVHTITNFINGLTVGTFAPTIRGESYGAATWHRLYCTYSIESDGSATILLFLAKPQFTLYAFQTWNTNKMTWATYHWNVPKQLAQLLIDAEQSVGRTAVPSYENEKGLVNIVVYERDFTKLGYLTNVVTSRECASTDYADIYWGVYDTTAYVAPMYVSGWSYGKRVTSNNDGSYDVIMTRRHTEYREYPNRYSSVSTLAARQEYEQRGVTTQSIPDISTSVRGLLYRQQVTPNDDCSKDVNTITDSRIYNSLDLRAIRAATLETHYRSDIKHSENPIAVSAAVQGHVYDTLNSVNELGYYDVVSDARKSHAKSTEFYNQSTKFRTGTAILYRNWLTAITAPPSDAGGEYRVNQNENLDGTYDADLIYTVGTNQGQALFASMNSTLGQSLDVLYKNRTTPVAAAASGQGFIYQATNVLDDQGLYDARLLYNASHSDSVSFRSQATSFKIADGILYRNWPTCLTAPDTTGSGEYRVSQSENTDGTYDGELIYVRGTDSGEFVFASTRSALLAEDSTIYKNRNSKVNAPEAGQGAIYQSSNVLDDQGTYDARLVYNQSYATNMTTQTRHGVLLDHKNILYRNSRNRIDISGLSPGAGEMYEAAEGFNQDGTYDGSLMYAVAQASSAAIPLLRSDAQDSDGCIYRSQRTIPALPESGHGYMYHANFQQNTDASYDGSLIYVGNKTQDVSVTWTDRWGTSKLYAFKNRSDPQTVITGLGLTDASDNGVSLSINQDGTYDGIITQTPFGGGSGSSADWDNKIHMWISSWEQDLRDGTQVDYVQIYDYNTTSRDTAEDFLYEYNCGLTRSPMRRNMNGTELRYKGKGHWQAHRVRHWVPGDDDPA